MWVLGSYLVIPALATDSHCSKMVREGKTVQTLYTELKQIRELYRNNGWTASQVRKYTEHELAVVWEWVDRISVPEKPAFLAVDEWDDGDTFIYLQISFQTKESVSTEHRAPFSSYPSSAPFNS